MAIKVSAEWVEAVLKEQPELPLEKRERFIRDYGIPPYDAGVLSSSRALADYYEEVARQSGNPKAASNWVMGDLLRFLNEEKRDIRECPVSAAALGEMIRLIDQGTISGKMAKEIIDAMYRTGKSAPAIIEEKGMVQITDESALSAVIAGILEANPNQLAQYRSGKDKLFGYFVGQVMKATKGKANPQLINDLLKKMLAG